MSVENLKLMLEKHGLETYPGCRLDLFQSVKEEYGEAIANDVIRYFSDIEMMNAVYNALLVNGIID
jgi:hypothetical protein|tara:strand:+ start:4949 stop:5146 length:198 start_codon:yes stop_codon:yes gene_type:complete